MCYQMRPAVATSNNTSEKPFRICLLFSHVYRRCDTFVGFIFLYFSACIIYASYVTTVVAMAVAWMGDSPSEKHFEESRTSAAKRQQSQSQQIEDDQSQWHCHDAMRKSALQLDLDKWHQMLYSLSTGYLYLYSLYLLAGAPKVCGKAIFLSNSIRQLLCADEYEMTFFLPFILFLILLAPSFHQLCILGWTKEKKCVLYLRISSDYRIFSLNKQKTLSRVKSI